MTIVPNTTLNVDKAYSEISKEKYLNKFINLGWYLFPIHWIENNKCSCGQVNCSKIGKHPITNNGFKDSTNDIDTIFNWHKEYPNANWGVRTGEYSKILVIDVDIRDSGVQNWNELTSTNEIPKTAKVKTPSGGQHCYFQMPDLNLGNSSGSLPEGIDVKANGGYVLLPKVSNGYEILCDLGYIADAPDWLINLITTKKVNTQTSIERIVVGKRNDTLYREACALRNRGYSFEETFQTISKLNQNRCEVALPKSDLPPKVVPQFEIVRPANSEKPALALQLGLVACNSVNCGV